MQHMPDAKTMPPGPEDEAALEHARRLTRIDAVVAGDSNPRRAGLIRDLAEAYFAPACKTVRHG
jgi:hypothetical protein